MNVKIYSTSTCPWCAKAKNFMKENNIPFEDVNVESNKEAAQEMIDKSGQMGVPVIDINGTIIVGFDKSAIENALGLK